MTHMPTVPTMMVASYVSAGVDTLGMVYFVKVKNALNISYICMRMFQDYMHVIQISTSVRWTMIVMKKMECALTLMDLIYVAVKWDSDSVALDSAAMVSQFVCLMMSWVCIVYVLSVTSMYLAIILCVPFSHEYSTNIILQILMSVQRVLICVILMLSVPTQLAATAVPAQWVTLGMEQAVV